jgi:hypothetical protein
MEALAREVLPPGFSMEWAELSHQQEHQGIPTIAIFAASALFVFLVLAAQYESWKLPLAIVLIVPMCLLASATGLGLRGMPRHSHANRLRRLGGIGREERDPGPRAEHSRRPFAATSSAASWPCC